MTRYDRRYEIYPTSEIFVYLLRRPTRWPAPFWEVLRCDAGDAVGRLAGAGVLHAEGAGGAGVGGEAPGSRWLCQHVAEGLLWWVGRSVSYPVAVWILLKASELSSSQRGSRKQRSLATPESELLLQVLPVSSWDFRGHTWDAHRQPSPPDFCYRLSFWFQTPPWETFVFFKHLSCRLYLRMFPSLCMTKAFKDTVYLRQTLGGVSDPNNLSVNLFRFPQNISDLEVPLCSLEYQFISLS